MNKSRLFYLNLKIFEIYIRVRIYIYIYICSIGKYQKDGDNMIKEINRQYFFNLNVNIIYVFLFEIYFSIFFRVHGL